MQVTSVTVGVCLTWVLSAAACHAESSSYSIMLGDRQIGNVIYDDSRSGGEALLSNLSNTPLGVGDGVFEGASNLARTASNELVRQYVGRSEKRTISVLFDNVGPIETVIAPAKEMTELSDASLAPDGALDPVRAFGRLTSQQACPDTFRIYDGRRAVQVTTTMASQSQADLVCELAYKVVAGPGHLSPFRFTDIEIVAIYDTAIQSGANLKEMTVSTNMFTLQIIR